MAAPACTRPDPRAQQRPDVGPLTYARTTPRSPLSKALGGAVDRRTVLRSAAFLGALAALGSPAETVAVAAGVQVLRGEIASAYVPGQPLRWRCAIPRDSRGLVLALHGKGASGSYWFTALDAPRIARETGLSIAAIDGGKTYWHPRRDSNASSMLVREFLPLLARRGLPTERIGLTGVSMGGYGALWLAAHLGPARVAGVATMSAALRHRYVDTSTGAFDDAQDFARNTIFARVDRLQQIPLWLACGTFDRFYQGNRDLAARLPLARTAFGPGGHTTAFSREYWGSAMRWLGRRM